MITIVRHLSKRPHGPRSVLWVALVGLIAHGAARAADLREPVIRRHIPATELQAVLVGDRPGALLPAEEFETLLAAARAAANASVPPEQGILTAADYVAEIEGDRLRLTCRLSFRAFQRGWTTISLPALGVSVLSARVLETSPDAAPQADAETAGPAPIARDPDNPDRILVFLNEPGPLQIELTLATLLHAVGSDLAAGFQLAAAPEGQLRLSVPAGRRLQVDGALPPRPAPDDQPADYVLAVGGRNDIQLMITDRREERREDAATFAHTAIGVVASPGEASWTARTQLSVFGRPLDQLECDVPAGLELTSVESMGLEAWELSDGGNGATRLTLTWRQPFSGVRAISLRGIFSRSADGRWTVPPLVVQNVSSHTGLLVLERPPGVRLQVLEATGLRQTSAAEARLRSAAEDPTAAGDDSSSLYFQIWTERFSLTYQPAEREREVQAAMTTLLSVNAQGVDLLSIVEFQTRFAAMFEADLELPAAWRIDGVTSGGHAVVQWQLIPREAGRNRVRIPLDPPLLPGESRTLTLSAHFDPEPWPVQDEPVRLAIPEVRLPQAGVIEALYGIAADDDLDIAPVEITGLDPARRRDLETLNRQLSPFQRTARLGFTYQDTVFQGQLEVRRMPVRLSAVTVALMRLEPETALTHVEAQLTIGGGGLREFVVALPESAGRDIRFTLAPHRPAPLFGTGGDAALAGRIAQQAAQIAPDLPFILEQQPGTAVNGVLPWNIRLDRYARGTFVLQARIAQPRPPAEDGAPQTWTVPAISIPGADRESGAVGVEAADEQHLSFTAVDSAGRPLPALDPIDFPPAHVRPEERLVGAWSFVRPGWNVTVSEERLPRTPIPSAVIESLNVASLVDSSGIRQTQLDARFSAVGMQAFDIALPETDELWSALIDDRPVEVRRADGAIRIPLSAVTPPDLRRTLRLVTAPVAARGAAPLEPRGDLQIQHPLPRFAVVTGQGAVEPIDILETNWTLHAPDDLAVVDARGRFRPVDSTKGDSLIRRLARFVESPTLRDPLSRVLFLAVIVVIGAAVGWARRRSTPLFAGCLCVLAAAMVVGVLLQGLSGPLQRLPGSRGGEWVTGGRDKFFLERARSEAPASATPLPAASEPAYDFAAHAPLAADERKLNEAIPQSEMSDLALPAPPVASGEGAPNLPGAASGSGPMLGAETAAGASIAIAQPSPARRPASGALLSVAFALAPPEGSAPSTLRTTSSAVDSETPGLDVTLRNRRQDQTSLLLIAVIVAAFGWWLRGASPRVRTLYAVVTLLGPIAARHLISGEWLPAADGVWLGGLLTVALWALRFAVRLIAVGVERVRARRLSSAVARTAAGLALVGGLLWAGSTPAEADNPDPLTVYVPYGDPASPLAARNVFVPQSAFEQLWQAAHPESAPPAAAPRDGAVALASYVADLRQIDVASDVQRSPATVRVQGRLLLHNFRESPIRLLLPLRSVPLRSATLNGEPAVVEVDAGSGMLAVAVPRSGVSVLDLSFDQPVETTGPAGRLAWQHGPVAAGQLSLRLPEGALETRIDGVRIAPRPADDGGAVLELAVDRGAAAVAWQPRSAQAADQAAVELQAIAVVAVSDASLDVRSQCALRVRQGTVSEFEFSLPANVRLKRISGPDLAGWRIDDEAQDRRLTVSFRRPIDTTTEFSIEVFLPLEIADAGSDFELTLPAPRGVARETLRLGLFAEPHLAVRPGELTGLARDETSSFPNPPPGGSPSPTSALQFAYRAIESPAVLRGRVERRLPETRAVARHGVLVSLRRQQVSSRISFQIAGAPRSTLQVALPDGFLLVDAASPHLQDYSVLREPGRGDILNIDLQQPTTGAVDVQVDGLIRREPQEPTASVAVPAPLQVARLDSELAVWVDDTYTSTIDSQADWRAVDPATLFEELRSLRPGPVQFAFRTTVLAPPAAVIALREQAAELAADVLTLIAVGDAAVDYGFTFQWTIARAATDRLTFTTPAWLRGRLDFAGDQVRQIVSTDGPDDRIRWTILLTDPVRDKFLLTAAASLPAPVDARVPAPELRFEKPGADGEPVPLDVQNQYVIAVNLSRSPLALEDPSAVTAIARENLPLRLPDALVQQAMSIVRVLPDRAAAWTIQPTGTTASVQAMVMASRLQTIVDWDGSWRTRVAYTVRNRGRQYLPVELPSADVRLLSVLVQSRPSRSVSTVIGNRRVQLVPLPPSSEADLSYDVVLHLAGKLASPLPDRPSLAAESLPLPAPRIVTTAESAEYGMPVAQTSWMVTLPDGVEASVDDLSNLTPHQSDEWGLMLVSQSLDQFEAEIAEMSRIAADARNSTSRRIQAQSNLKKLSLMLESYEPATSSATYGREIAGKAGELQADNTRRYRELSAQVKKELSDSSELDGAAPTVEFDAEGLDLSFRQGSFQANGGDAVWGEPGQGQAFVVGNAGEILRFNRNDLQPADTLSDGERTFGFRLFSSAVGDKTRVQSQVELESRRSRSGLKDSLSRQDAGLGGGRGGFVQGGAGLDNDRLGRIQLDRFGASRRNLELATEEGESQQRGMQIDTLESLAALPAPAQGWQEIGGLSLPIELPALQGRELGFSKSGGDPRLVLRARSAEARTIAWSSGEALLWLAVGLMLVAAAGQPRFSALIGTLAAIGAGAGFLLAPGDLRWAFLAVFAVAALSMLLRRPIPRTAP
ncbi:MAG: hypothetical protein KF774_19045 [Planctomyces sp.]|nr:hypothetical protein [Planctomyces sp.]